MCGSVVQVKLSVLYRNVSASACRVCGALRHTVYFNFSYCSCPVICYMFDPLDAV